MEPKLKVLITVNFAAHLLEQIEAVSPLLQVKVVEAREDRDIPEEDWLEADILYTHKVLPALEQAPELKWIQFHRAGNEAFMEEPILRKPGLQATTMSGASALQVAEYILEMILALGHRLPLLMEHQQNANWASDRGEIFLPRELNQSTVGIVGYGSIGRQAAQLLTAFGAQVLAIKQDAMKPADEGYTLEGAGDSQGDFVQRLYPAEALISMLRECDFVVVCVPLTDDTWGLIGETQLDEMKSTAYLVDVSRGGVVDHAALITALKEGKIKGAALDVYPEEPLPQGSPLWKMPDVILTPHIAGASREYNARAVDLFIENLERFFEGKPLLNVIDMQRGY
jgi:phosphoglycerate dehydrogenase-like enzyme